MPGLVNDFMQLPPDQKQKLIAYAGQALGARGGDINNVMAKLQANPAMAMQFMERSGVGVANPIRGASGDRAWEPDFASTVSRSMQDTPSSSNVRQAQPKSNKQQASGANSGGGPPQPPRRDFPATRDENVANVAPPRRPSDIDGGPAGARPGDADMGLGGLAAGGAGMVGAAMLARALRGRGGAEPPTRSGLPATTRGNLPELTTMDELMGAPAAIAGTRNPPRQLTDQRAKRTDENGMYDPRDPRNASAEQNAARNITDFGGVNEIEESPVGKPKDILGGPGPDDLARMDDVMGSREVTTTKPRYDQEGYRKSQVPDDTSQGQEPGTRNPPRQIADQREAEAGPAPVDKGNAKPGAEASDLATYKENFGDEGTAPTTVPKKTTTPKGRKVGKPNVRFK